MLPWSFHRHWVLLCLCCCEDMESMTKAWSEQWQQIFSLQFSSFCRKFCLLWIRLEFVPGFCRCAEQQAARRDREASGGHSAALCSWLILAQVLLVIALMCTISYHLRACKICQATRETSCYLRASKMCGAKLCHLVASWSNSPREARICHVKGSSKPSTRQWIASVSMRSMTRWLDWRLDDIGWYCWIIGWYWMILDDIGCLPIPTFRSQGWLVELVLSLCVSCISWQSLAEIWNFRSNFPSLASAKVDSGDLTRTYLT